jgi:hypothetical protein
VGSHDVRVRMLRDDKALAKLQQQKKTSVAVILCQSDYV